MAAVASPSDSPCGKLKENVVATNGPWWLIDNGVVPGPNELNAASGTIVSWDVLTDEPAEALPRPLFVSELSCWLRTEFEAISAADCAVTEFTTVVPATAPVACVPLAGAAAVLT